MVLVAPSLDLQGLANNRANTKYNPQIADATRQLDWQSINDNSNIMAIQGWGAIGGDVIKSTYDELLNDLSRNATEQQGTFNSTLQNNADAYAQVNRASEANKQDALAYLRTLGGNLGTDVAPESNRLLNEINPMQDRMTQYGANAGADMRQWATNHLGLLNRGIDDSKRVSAQQQAAFAQTIAGELAKATSQKSQNEFFGRARVSDLQGEKGSYAVDAMSQLFGEDWDRQVQADSSNQGWTGLANQVSMHNADIADRAAARQFQADQDAANASNDDYWKQLGYGLDRDRLGLDREKAEHDWMSTGVENPSYSGQNGLAQWARDNNVSPEIMGAINSAYTTANNTALADPTKAGMEPNIAMSALTSGLTGQQTRGYRPQRGLGGPTIPRTIDPALAQAGLSILYNNYGGRK